MLSTEAKTSTAEEFGEFHRHSALGARAWPVTLATSANWTIIFSGHRRSFRLCHHRLLDSTFFIALASMTLASVDIPCCAPIVDLLRKEFSPKMPSAAVHRRALCLHI